MSSWSRRKFFRTVGVDAVKYVASLSALGQIIRQAAAVEPFHNKGTIEDVAHIVVLTQENRSFDHYFGALRGVCGFSDRFALPVAASTGSRTVMQQPRASGNRGGESLLPFHLDTLKDFSLMRGEGTPHSWSDAQQAWDHGRMAAWTRAKGDHSMGYYTRADLPFHYALAEAFTVCDAYHCSFHGGTNTNRLFMWTGTNDPSGLHHGPATHNDLDSLHSKPEFAPYTWTTYAERLQAAGITWQVYQDMADNFEDNPLVGFQQFREAHRNPSGALTPLWERGLKTRDLAQLRADVVADKLPQVSWIVAEAANSEHPDVSSPAQGALYTARVLEALTSNPDVWRRTALILNFDENDGYFDHVPPPAPPSVLQWHVDPAARRYAGASTVSTAGEYHEMLTPYRSAAEDHALLHRPYGLGPRVPMLVISPWSRGGWVNSQVFDHTSVIRFIERRFGVMEPQISPWRRAVCGDLTSAFDFSKPDHTPWQLLPETSARAHRAASFPRRTVPFPDGMPQVLVQEAGQRPSRALPYELQVHDHYSNEDLALRFINSGSAAAVLHVIDRCNLEKIPRRYTVESARELMDHWPVSEQRAYDLWILGPHGFHRHFIGRWDASAALQAHPEIQVHYDVRRTSLELRMRNTGVAPCTFLIQVNAYAPKRSWNHTVTAGSQAVQRLDLRGSHGWYDCSVRALARGQFVRRFAGRMETGLHSVSAPSTT